MRYTVTIDNMFCLKYKLDLKQGYLYSWLRELPTWSERIIINNEAWYFASRNKACEELPLLTTKPDTMYRHYKALADQNIIYWKKIDGKDYISFNPTIALDWNRVKENELPNTRKNIRKNSEENPTNKNIRDNNINKEAYRLSMENGNEKYLSQKQESCRAIFNAHTFTIQNTQKNRGVPLPLEELFSSWWAEYFHAPFNDEKHLVNSVRKHIEALSRSKRRPQPKPEPINTASVKTLNEL